MCASPPPAETAVTWLLGLLDRGRLDAFGADKLAKIRQKLAENATDWLNRLVNSREFGRVLGAI